MSPAFDLTGRVAAITGGNGGIGLAMARALAAAGAKIAIVARNKSKSEKAAGELKKAGTEVLLIEADVTAQQDCLRLVNEVVTRFGRLDILVNNAGTNDRKAPEAYSVREWNDLIAVNLTSAFLCSQAAYPKMREAGGGKIINIGSMLSLFGSSFAAPYAAAKGGVVQLTKSLAVSWARDGVQVNAILPGWIDTDLTKSAKKQVPGLHEKITARTPAGRWGKPADLEGIAVFLASGASDIVTGTAIPVDGGYSANG